MAHAAKPEAAAIQRIDDSGPPGETEAGTDRRGWLLSVGSVVLAFLASQHHTLMMALMAAGLSNAAMGFMTAVPLVRRVMLGMSLVMVVVIGYRVIGSGRPRAMRVLGVVSIVATIGLAAWSVARFGW